MEMNDRELIIEMIKDGISEFKNEIVNDLLNKLNINKLEVKDSDELLHLLLSVCYISNNKTIVDNIFYVWTLVYPAGQYSNFTSVLFTIPLFEIEILKFVVESKKDMTFLSLIDDLIHLNSDDNILIACYKALDVFGEQPKMIYKNLIELTKNLYILQGIQNLRVEEFLLDRLRKLEDYAEIPLYIKSNKGNKNFNLGNLSKIFHHIKDNDKVFYEIPNDEILLETLLDFYKNDGISEDMLLEIRLQVSSQLVNLDEENKAMLVKKLNFTKHLLELQNDKKIFKILGPANPIINTLDIDELTYGGSRMLISKDYDYDDSETFVPWFEGFCYQCNKRIRKKCHSVRKPLLIGGWIGCYCSWECAAESANIETEYPILELIKYYKNMCDKIGILDYYDTIEEPIPETKDLCDIAEIDYFSNMNDSTES